MASAFAAQLRTIAQNSTHELDRRARRDAHAESLIFPKEIAVKQDFDSIFALCSEGFRDLCSLDATFVEFERNLFSPQSIRTEREQMNKSGNETLDTVLERCLAMLSSKLLLKPGVKCLEWLIRRFRVHVNNTSALLLSVLPWHETTVWRNVFSLIPKGRCTASWKFLGRYKEEALSIPRTALVYAVSTSDGFFSLFNKHVIDTSRDGTSYPGLLKFWAGIVAEAVLGRLDAAKSGRKEIQRQKTEDILLKVLPVLSDGFEVRGCPDLTTTCLTLAMLLAGKADLDDRVLDSLLHTIATTVHHPDADEKAAVMAMAVIVGQKQTSILPKSILDVFMKIENLESALTDLGRSLLLDSLFKSLLIAALSNTKRKHVEKRLAFIEKLLQFSSDSEQVQLIRSATEILPNQISKLKADSDSIDSFGNLALHLVLRLLDEQRFHFAESKAVESQLEELFDRTPRHLEVPSNDMEIDLPITTSSTINEMLQRVPSQAVEGQTSFLQTNCPDNFTRLLETFIACSKTPEDLQRFIQLPFWASTKTRSLLISFLLRAGASSLPSSQQAAALRLIGADLRTGGLHDGQVLLPFILTKLSDPAPGTRKVAADLLMAVEKNLSNETTPREDVLSHLYDHNQLQHIKQVSTSHFKKIIHQVLLPAVEEFMLDATQLAQTIRLAINGYHEPFPSSSSASQVDLKKSLRLDLFQLLVGYTLAIPLYRTKIAIISLLRDIHKIGTNFKSEMLEPALKQWILLDEDKARRLADKEALRLSEIDTAMVEIVSPVSPQDKDAVSRVLKTLTETDFLPRAELVTVIFARIQYLWKDLRHDAQVATAQRLFELSFSDHAAFAKGAQSVLRSVKLDTDILGLLLDNSASGVASINNDERQQPKKKRRTSHGQHSIPPDQLQLMKAAASRLTLALEIVDDSRPEDKPQLMPALFDVLTILKRFKQQQPYLLNLCLSGILAIVNAQKSISTQKIDISSIRSDLVVECIMSSGSTQVQTTALLLSASLASIAPDRLLHSVMPIFTFMGSNMFSKEDEHSIFVVDQTIDQIIPILVHSLKKQNKDLVKSTSGLLASFTTAYDHIPQPRRVPIYSRLLIRMGADEFAFILFAMLSHRSASQLSFDSFFTDLLAEMDATTQLTAFQQSVNLANDLIMPQPHFADEIFGFSQSTASYERPHAAKTVSQMALRILKSPKLKLQFGRLHKLTSDVSKTLLTQFDTSLRSVLATIKDRDRDNHEILHEAEGFLDALLGLPALAQLFDLLPQALANMDIGEGLKPRILRVVAAQVTKKPVKDSRTRVAAIDLLAHLTDLLSTDTDAATAQAIIVCIDQLTEIYGRKDPERVLAAATAVLSDQCIDAADTRLVTMSLLCLASMIEVLKESCIPIIPGTMAKMIGILRNTIRKDVEEVDLHNAAYTLLAAIATHVPFVLSDDNLQALLVLSSMSAVKYKTTNTADPRLEALSIIASKVDLQTLLNCLLGEALDASREHAEDAEIEVLTMFSTSLTTANKANVTRNADLVSQILLAHLDQRNRLHAKNAIPDERTMKTLKRLEDKINEISIIFIYKLNDTVFRPIYESWIDWATNAHDVEDLMDIDMVKTLRQTALFNLLTHFFNTLQSIVTSYASYIIGPSHMVLSAMAKVAESREQSVSSVNMGLYKSSLQMLQAACVHDADGFFTAPSHFEPIGPLLVNQLGLATSKVHRQMVYDDIIPTIVNLATATLDTPTHHQSISHTIVQLRHSPSAAVRLASIKTLARITDDEDVSEEFIANVIGIGSGEGEGARGVGGGGSVGEIMIYVNEMLEDDDEEVEREVRKWVQSVRQKTGEDVFEV